MSAEQIALSSQLLTFTVYGQLFGVPVLQVNDVLRSQKVTRAPLAPSSVAGIMNLRGRIVTAIEMRKYLKQPERAKEEPHMSVVIDHQGELFSLIIDSVGDVLTLDESTYEDTPVTMAPVWRSITTGIHKLDGQILLVLDIMRLLQLAENKEGVQQ